MMSVCMSPKQPGCQLDQDDINRKNNDGKKGSGVSTEENSARRQ